jgi:hypothetical protein
MGKRQDRRRGVVLIAALAFVAFLAVAVTRQLERLPHVTNESRVAVAAVQRELTMRSALQLAIGVLKADPAGTDTFADSWTRPHRATLGTAEIGVRIGDWAFLEVPRDRWLLHDLGIPDGVTVIATDDPTVHGLFRRSRPNVNTSPLPALGEKTGLGRAGLAWIRTQRGSGGVSSLQDLNEARELEGINADAVAVSSELFLVEASVTYPDSGPQRRLWVVHRDGGNVAVVYSSPEGAMP